MAYYIQRSKIGLLLLIGVSFLSFIPVASAEENKNPFTSDLTGDVATQLPSDIRQGAGGEDTITDLAIKVIKVFLSVLGILATIVVLYAGAKWMTAGGNSEQVESAKKTLKNAIIGLILIFMAYSIAFWIGTTIGGSTSVGSQFQGPRF